MASESETGTPRPFDVKTVEYLIGLMAQHELAEISLKEGEQKIRLRKAVAAPLIPATLAAPVAPAPAFAAPAVAPTAPAVVVPNLFEIKSETPGTFYSRPKPDKDDFVSVGATIRPDTTVCLIEAMKIFDEIKAKCAGIVREVCVKNGDAVDYGTVLFRVETSQ
ncbi:MAG: hypothetical protein LC104_02630 [Bacteroidales bacterium]|nr:hypothetical protein [Bacteroidales bacterium]